MRLSTLLVAAGLAVPALTHPALAQTDSLTSAKPEAQRWFRPRHLTLQTGGGVGMLAAGVGYSFWRDRTEVDVLLGYVPKKYAGSALTIATFKLLYSPFTLPLRERWQLKPLTVGGYASYSYGVINPGERNQYPAGYYWWSTKGRVGPLLGSRITYVRPASTEGRPRNISFYYELGTNDLYLVSYVQNRRGLSPADITTLTLGLKADF